jgi:hypothetical protein
MLLLLAAASALLILVGVTRLFVRLGPRRFVVAMLGTALVVAAVVGIVKVTGCGMGPDHLDLVDETVAGQRWLRHPAFELHHPGPAYTEDRALASELEGYWTTCDAYHQPGAALVVCAIEVSVTSRAEFFEQVRSAQRGVTRAEIAALPTFSDAGTKLVDDIGYADGNGTAYLRFVMRSGVHIRLKMFTIEGGLAMLLVTSRAPDELADVITSFAPAR